MPDPTSEVSPSAAPTIATQTSTAPSGMTSGIATPAGIPNTNMAQSMTGDRTAPLTLRQMSKRAGGR